MRTGTNRFDQTTRRGTGTSPPYPINFCRRGLGVLTCVLGPGQGCQFNHCTAGWGLLVRPDPAAPVTEVLTRIPVRLESKPVTPWTTGSWEWVAVAGRVPESDPAQLIRRISYGDDAAFTGLFVRFRKEVFSFVHRLLRDQHQVAEEVMQETFLQIWEQAHSYDPAAGSVQSWIFRLAGRRAASRIGSVQASRLRDGRYSAGDHRIDGDDPAELVLSDLDRSAIRQGVMQLSSAQRESIMLAFYDGLSYPEIADVLHVPLPTVKTRIRNGLIRLREAVPAAV